MKKFRFLSAVMAACLSLSMFAGAANVPAEEVVTHTGTAVVVDENGNSTETPYEFTAPAGASDEEIAVMSQNAAYLATHDGPMARASQQQLASKMHVDIPRRGDEYYLSCKKLDFTASELCIYLDAVINCSKVYVSCENDTRGDYVSTSEDITSGRTYVYFFDSKSPRITMEKGNYLTLGFSANSDDAYTNMILVTAFS